MEQSTAPTAVVAQPKTIVIERRWAIVGGAMIAALIIGLGIALAFAAGDDHGVGRPAGLPLSAHARAMRPDSRRATAARCLRACRCRKRRTAAIRRVAARPPIRPRKFQPHPEARGGPRAELAGRQRFRRELEPVATAVDTAHEPCGA